MTFTSKLTSAQQTNNSWVCVGLDPVMERMPEAVMDNESPFLAFGRAIVEATADALDLPPPRGRVPLVLARAAAYVADVAARVPGFDPLIVAERKLMDYRKVELSFDRFGKVKGWDTEEDFQVEFRNRSEKSITIEVLEHQDGDWTLTSDTAFEKVDQNTVKFMLEVPSQATRTIKFHVSKHFGKNSQG